MTAKKSTKRKTAEKTADPGAAADVSPTDSVVPRHQWTNGGAEVLLLKCVEKDGKSYGGFQWPLTVGAEVSALDWSDTAECGGGLHGWPWGFSLGDGKEPDWAATWLVFGVDPKTTVDLGGKCKAPNGVIRYVGEWQGATAFVLDGQMAWVHHAASGAASATGESGAASATGGRGAASATGESGAASATGGRGAASATGGRGAASATGESGAAVVTGHDGKAQAGPFGCIALALWTQKSSDLKCDAPRSAAGMARTGN